ncbi:MAG: SDR family NAD(P)-dependent oxidoreductase [Acetobacteraceae bacterium]
MQLYDHVLITGASGGIGAALAQHYAAQAERISLWGRDLQRLEFLAKICAATGAETDIVVLDLSNMQESLDAFTRAEARAPIDLLFLNAGVSDMRQPGRVVETPDILLETALVNYAVPTPGSRVSRPSLWLNAVAAISSSPALSRHGMICLSRPLIALQKRG